MVVGGERGGGIQGLGGVKGLGGGRLGRGLGGQGGGVALFGTLREKPEEPSLRDSEPSADSAVWFADAAVTCPNASPVLSKKLAGKRWCLQNKKTVLHACVIG